MGFINDKRHHSRQSAYYHEDGAEMYNYSESINTSFVTPGNFRKTVFTKHEFKIAKMVLEQAIASAPKNVSFFNCSDGAQIVGAAPLTIDSVLVTASSEDKKQAVANVKNGAFKRQESKDVIERYEDRYSSKVIATELDAFGKWLDKPVDSIKDAEALVDQQKNMLFYSYQNGRSLLFYYLYGTVNFANAMLTKLLYSSKENGVEQFSKGLDIWREYFQRFKVKILEQQSAFDVSMSPNNLLKRACNVLQYKYNNKRIAVITNSTGYVEAINYFMDKLIELPEAKVEFLTLNDMEQIDAKKHHFDFVIYHFVAEFDAPDLSTTAKALKFMRLQGKTSTLFVDYHFNRDELAELHDNWSGNHGSSNFTVLKMTRDPRTFAESKWLSDLARTALGSLFSALENHYHVVFAKYPVIDTYDVEEFETAMAFDVKEGDVVYTHYRHLCVDFNGDKGSTGLMVVGDRGRPVESLSDHTLFIAFTLTQDQYHDTYQKMNELLPAVIKDSPFESDKQVGI